MHRPGFQHSEVSLPCLGGWGEVGGGGFCREGRAVQDLELPLGFSPPEVVRDGAGPLKGGFGEALKFPFQAAEKR